MPLSELKKPKSLIEETLYTDGLNFFSALMTAIHEATDSVDIETYIFANDHLGQAIAQTAIKAAQRGVQVRILVDGAGTPNWGMNMAYLLEKAGVQTKIYHPFPWQLWNWSRSVVRLPLVIKVIYLCLKINARNHRKACVIDRKIAFMGSFNISKVHLHYSEGGANWRDTGIRIKNAPLDTWTDAFNQAWHRHAVRERLRDVFRHIRQNPMIRLNNSRHRRRILYKNLLKRMQKCHTKIWITNAYFIPDTYLLKRLKDAAKRGVDVRIVLPKKSDFFLMPWASSRFYISLLRAGVRIFEYLPSILHAKTVILDQWMLVGSSNLNHRSLLHDLEVDINPRCQHIQQQLERQYLIDLEASKEITLSQWPKTRPFWQKLVGQLALYMKYWI